MTNYCSEYIRRALFAYHEGTIIIIHTSGYKLYNYDTHYVYFSVHIGEFFSCSW